MTRLFITTFHGEALGLEAMYECSQGSEDTLRIPKVYNYGDYTTGKGSFLVMEYLNLAGRSDDKALGKAIARMHLSPATAEAGNPDKAFGFPVDNTIGGTPQPNPWTKTNSRTNEWIEFFRDHRIGHQLDLAGDPYCSNLWEKDIAPRLNLLFEDLTGEREIKPSLLHGDLWSGNIGSADGKPSIFDPAVYWGHHVGGFHDNLFASILSMHVSHFTMYQPFQCFKFNDGHGEVVDEATHVLKVLPLIFAKACQEVMRMSSP